MAGLWRFSTRKERGLSFRRIACLPRYQLLVLDPLGLIRLRALPLVQIRLVLLVVPREPHELTLLLERQHVRRRAGIAEFADNLH